jgi:N-acetyl-gamma-glutamyl-phosphate reductase
MGVRVGIVGVSGYGGSELLRLCVGHPAFDVVYASGETTAGQRLDQQFPALG